MIVRLADGVGLWAGSTGSGPPVVLVHGFTGSGREWDEVASALGEGTRCIAVDLIGHGRSDAPADPARYALERASVDLGATLDVLSVPRACVVGYSLGGRVALRMALDAPERVAALLLVSATAGIEVADARAARRAADLALAERIEREGVERFADEWSASDLFAGERTLPAERREATRRVRLAQRPHGLAHSLRGMGQGACEPMWDRLAEVGAPTLIVTGARDARYSQLGARIAARIRGARHVEVPEAGHAVHRERPGEIAALIASHIRALAADGGTRRTTEALT